jgi:hypothetical protein
MTATPLAERKAYSGTVSRAGKSATLKVDIGINASGAVEFDFGSIPLSNETSFILTDWHQPDGEVPYFSFAGTAEDGMRFDTDYLMFDGMGSASDASGSRLTPDARCAKGTLHFSLTKPQELPLLRMRLKGFDNFGRLHQSCRVCTENLNPTIVVMKSAQNGA